MSISSEITRITNAKEDIITAIKNKGGTVEEGTKIDGLSSCIDNIDQGIIADGYKVRRENHDLAANEYPKNTMVAINDTASVDISNIRSDMTHSFDPYTHIIRPSLDSSFCLIVSMYAYSATTFGLLIEAARVDSNGYIPLQKWVTPVLFSCTLSQLKNVKSNMHSTALSDSDFVIGFFSGKDQDGTALATNQVRIIAIHLSDSLSSSMIPFESNVKMTYCDRKFSITNSRFDIWGMNASRGCTIADRSQYISMITPLSNNSFVIPTVYQKSTSDTTSSTVLLPVFKVSNSDTSVGVEVMEGYDTQYSLSYSYTVMPSSGTAYYFNKPRLILTQNDTFLMIMGYGTKATYATSYATGLKYNDNGKFTLGVSANINCIIGYYDMISLSDFSSATNKDTVIIASGLNSTALSVYSITITSSLELQIGTADDNTTGLYKNYTLKSTPTSIYNFVKLVRCDDSVYLVSLSFAAQFSVKIGNISSSDSLGFTLLDMDDYSYTTLDASDCPEMFFSAYMSKHLGSFSIGNCMINEYGVITFPKTMPDVSNSYYQSYALFESIGISMYLFDKFTINSEISSIINFSKCGEIYIVIDEMPVLPSTSYPMLRLTTYKYINRLFKQCGGGKVISGLLYNAIVKSTNASTMSSSAQCVEVPHLSTDTGIFYAVCASFYDNVVHERNAQYLYIFKVWSTIYDIMEYAKYKVLSSCTNANIIKSISNTTDDGGELNVLVSATHIDAINKITVDIIKTSSGKYSLSDECTCTSLLTLSSTLTCPYNHFINTSDGYSLIWFDNSYGNTTNYYELKSDTLLLSHDDIVKNTVEGITNNAIGCNNLKTGLYIIGETFHDNIILGIYNNAVYSYFWNKDDDGKFYLRDIYTCNSALPTNANYAAVNNWYVKISEYEILVFNQSSKEYMLLYVSKEGKINLLNFMNNIVSANKPIGTITTTPRTCNLINMTNQLYMLNPAAMTVPDYPNTYNMALLPININRLFTKLTSYAITNSGFTPVGIVSKASYFSRFDMASGEFKSGYRADIIIPEI